MRHDRRQRVTVNPAWQFIAHNLIIAEKQRTINLMIRIMPYAKHCNLRLNFEFQQSAKVTRQLFNFVNHAYGADGYAAVRVNNG